MRRDVAATDEGMVAIRTVDDELHLFTPERAEVVANRYADPFRSHILKAMDEARRDEQVSNIPF